MIEPVIFVQVLATAALNGDRASSKSPAWQVLVVNGDMKFYPVSGFSCFADGYYFKKPAALEWARTVAGTLGGIPIMVYEDRPDVGPVFVEDLV